jgi:hypothetical protein
MKINANSAIGIIQNKNCRNMGGNISERTKFTGIINANNPPTARNTKCLGLNDFFDSIGLLFWRGALFRQDLHINLPLTSMPQSLQIALPQDVHMPIASTIG